MMKTCSYLESNFLNQKKLLTQENHVLIETENSMSAQDNLANQEKVVVNGRYCVETESLCVRKEIDV